MAGASSAKVNAYLRALDATRAQAKQCGTRQSRARPGHTHARASLVANSLSLTSLQASAQIAPLLPTSAKRLLAAAVPKLAALGSSRLRRKLEAAAHRLP